MKKHLIPVLLFAFAAYAQDTPRMAVDRFFAAFHAKDSAALRLTLHKTASMHSISERREGPKLSGETVAELLTAIASMPPEMKFEEKLLSYNEQIDGNMANVWTPYEFFINGKRSHGGVNSFQVFREGGIWKIIHIADTRRK